MKDKTVYICRECGARSPKWQGRCHICGEWQSFEEEKIISGKHKLRRTNSTKASVVRLGDITADNEYRFKTGISELDRVLGGGIIPGSFVLIGGDPGIGKSTLTLQMCGKLSGHKPLYVTGEESLQQIKYRSNRLKIDNEDLQILAETNLEQIDSTIKAGEFGVVFIDSIQSVYSSGIEATPGSVVQVRECASLLMQTAKQLNVPMFIVGHVTKEGIIAGPKILEHMVDTVLQFEGEKTFTYRILRAHKNRFGSTNEIGIFEMTEDGLREVDNPSRIFIAGRHHDESGISIIAAIEGTRPILHEVQALVTPTGFSVPQRTANGLDLKRLHLILAVLEKRLGAKFRQNDVFLNVAGGGYLNDPSADLGIAAALMSSLRESAMDPLSVMIGEIGLTGEIRPVSMIEQRIIEAEKLGFRKVVLPKSCLEKLSRKFSIKLIGVEKISLALSELLSQ